MRRLIREFGSCGLVPETRRSPFQSLVLAVAHQQLNSKAAGSILSRFKKLFPGRRFLRPEDLAGVTDEQIRARSVLSSQVQREKSASDTQPQVVRQEDLPVLEPRVTVRLAQEPRERRAVDRV